MNCEKGAAWEQVTCALASLERALEPSILDWISGVVVPLMLGCLTLFVAIWAGRIAKKSNALAVQLHKETQAVEARRLRANYAHELMAFVNRFPAGRLAGLDANQQLRDSLDDNARLAEAQARADDVTANTLTSWASQIARKGTMTGVDAFDGFMNLQVRVKQMIDLWVQDPATAIHLIKSDEEYLAIMARERATVPS